MSKYSSFFLVSSPEYESLADKLRIRKYGSWLAEEVWIREEQAQKRALFTLKAVELAKKIAKDKEISNDEAFQLLQSQGFAGSELSDIYGEEAAELMASMPSSQEQLEKLVTTFMRNRGEVCNSKKWEPTEDWSDEDTAKLPRPILEKIEAFMASEEMVSRGDTTEAAPQEASEKN